jgi:hypothetical protein
VEQTEAEALAHVASTQTGLTARSEKTEGGAWAVLLVDSGNVHRFLDAHAYRIWWDERNGISPDYGLPGSRLGRWFRRRRSEPEANVPDESTSVASLKPWEANSFPGGSLHGAIRGMEDKEEIRDYAYRIAHPPEDH